MKSALNHEESTGKDGKLGSPKGLAMEFGPIGSLKGLSIESRAQRGGKKRVNVVEELSGYRLNTFEKDNMTSMFNPLCQSK